VTAAAHAALASGNVAAARRLAARARRAADHLKLPRLLFAAHAVSFLIADHTGRRSQADAHLETSLGALEAVRAGLGPDALRAALLEGREAWLARAVRHTLDGPDGSRRALEIIERFRARALLDLAVTEERIVGSPAEITELRTRLAALERSTGERGIAPLLRTAPARPSARTQRRLVAAERALRDAVERARPPGTRRDLDLNALRAKLPARTCVLSLFSDDEGTCLFVLERQGLHLVRTSTTRTQVADLVDTLRFRLGRFAIDAAFVSRHQERLERDTEQALQAVASEVLAPIEGLLEDVDDLIVIPSGPWHHVPFAALPFHGAPLVQSATIALSPALAALGAGGPVARGRPIVCGFSDEHAPSIENEVEHVAAALPRARLFKGNGATFAALRALPRPRCLHLAAHGRYRPDAPAMSGLQLHDGWLRAADFSLLDLRGSLVVLSGCETGVSAVRAGDEAHGLVRGAFASGARQLIASLWRVDDQSTTDLMLRFHAERSRVGSAVHALASAQASLAQEGRPAWLWAGFSVWTRVLPT
jgi:CHAT domain-containing protein